MRKAQILVNNVAAGILEELAENHYCFSYLSEYTGDPVSLTMQDKTHIYEFDRFPAFFDGLLPEGIQLEALLRKYKLNKKDYLSQLIQVGEDLVGAVTIKEIK